MRYDRFVPFETDDDRFLLTDDDVVAIPLLKPFNRVWLVSTEEKEADDDRDASPFDAVAATVCGD